MAVWEIDAVTARHITRARLAGLAAVILALASPPAVSGQLEQPEEASAARAREVWETAIAAKGGRERLHAIRNMVVSSIHRYRRHFLPRRVITESLYVLPHKSWGYDDQRPEVFGITIWWADLDRMLECIEPSDKHAPTQIQSRQGKESAYDLVQAEYLMETNWFRPKPLRSYPTKMGRRKVIVVETVSGPGRFAYTLDPRTHLPLKMAWRYENWRDGGRLYGADYNFYDYAPVAGIQMPHRIGYTHRAGEYVRGEYRTHEKYQFNVKYDPTIFERVPRIEDGPQGWKPKAP